MTFPLIEEENEAKRGKMTCSNAGVETRSSVLASEVLSQGTGNTSTMCLQTVDYFFLAFV